MSVNQRILISYEEYQRLLQSDKQLKHFLQKKDAEKEESSRSSPGSDLTGAGVSAEDLAGAGNSKHMSLWPETLPNGGPALINTVVSPPAPSPNVFHALYPDRTDRIREEAKRDKTLPPALPLNDPLGIPDPSLGEGQAPREPFVATQLQRDQDKSVSLGHPPTSREVAAAAQEGGADQWWYIGPEDFEDSTEEDEDW